MKRIILVIAFLSFIFTINAQKGKVNWMSLEEATIAQAKEPRKIILDVYTKWCGPCKLLDKNTFQNADVANYINENYYAVKFNAEGGKDVTFKDKTYSNPDYDSNRKGRNSQHQLAQYLGVSGYPTIVFLDDNSNLITPLTGYRGPKDLELFLKLFATDKYKEVTTKEQFEAYQKTFKPQFRG